MKQTHQSNFFSIKIDSDINQSTSTIDLSDSVRTSEGQTIKTKTISFLLAIRGLSVAIITSLLEQV